MILIFTSLSVFFWHDMQLSLKTQLCSKFFTVACYRLNGSYFLLKAFTILTFFFLFRLLKKSSSKNSNSWILENAYLTTNSEGKCSVWAYAKEMYFILILYIPVHIKIICHFLVPIDGFLYILPIFHKGWSASM